MKRVVFRAALCLAPLFLRVPLCAESEFVFQAAPVVELPLGVRNFMPGAGAAANLAWSFLPFMGISAGGAFTGLTIDDGSTFNSVKGNAGIFFKARPFERWTFRGDIKSGIYQYGWNEYNNVRPEVSLSLSAEFHVTPYFSVFGEGGYTWQAFSDSGGIHLADIAVGARLNLSQLMRGQARIRGEKTEQKNIFPVSYAWYRDNPFAAVRVFNDERNTITNLSLSLDMDQYLGEPYEFARLSNIKSGESAEFHITAGFNEYMLNLTENTLASGQILVRYRSLGMLKEASFPVQMPLFHRNAMSWDDDRRAASFVSAKDPAARLFARYTASVADSLPSLDIPRNVRYAACLFEALNLYGIGYVIDPLSSYTEMSDNAAALDSLGYPYQTLLFRGGDCDDLSILFCSLLEVLEIETAFITVPGHIYMAFNSGCKIDAPLPAAGKINCIEHDGYFWVPVEITLPDRGFLGAWRAGASEWKSASQQRRLYLMKENWDEYPAVSVPIAGDRMPPLPDEETLRKAFQSALDSARPFFSNGR